MNTFIDLSLKSPQDLLQKRVSVSPVIRKFSRPILFKDCQPNERTFTSINKQFTGSFKISYFSIPPIRSSLKSNKLSSNHGNQLNQISHVPCSSSPYQNKVSKLNKPNLNSSPEPSAKATFLRTNLNKPQNLAVLSKTLKPKYINLEINPNS